MSDNEETGAAEPVAAALTAAVLDEEAARQAGHADHAAEVVFADDLLPGVGSEEMPLREGLACCGLAGGDLDLARREARLLCKVAAASGEATYLTLGRRALTEAALADGDSAEAAERLDEKKAARRNYLKALEAGHRVKEAEEALLRLED